MKRTLSVLIVILILAFSGCKEKEPEINKKSEVGYINGVWISYIELDKMVEQGDFKENFTAAINNCKSLDITDIFLHVVPFCDAAYNSEIYHLRYDKDILKEAIEICHRNDIRIHAWINPYRVQTLSGNTEALNKQSIAYKWLNDDDKQNDINICVFENGIYLNPASANARETVINATRELCKNYDIDGVHLDDYFYPTTSEEFDKQSYADYISTTDNPLSLSDYRRASVNALVSGLYTAIKFINKDIIFSISPAADIAKNKETYFADIAAWCESGCVDFIIPQLYFGYEYNIERFCFDNILKEWQNMVKDTGTDLCIGLAAYKIGINDEANGEEWAIFDDVLARQTKRCVEDKSIKGHVYYSYTSIFSDNELNKKAIEKVKTVLNAKK